MIRDLSTTCMCAPRGIDVDKVRDALAAVPGVQGVHDLHVWTITSGMDSLSAHLVVADGRPATELLLEVRRLLAATFGIDHVTIQIEPEDFGAHTACPHPNCR